MNTLLISVTATRDGGRGVKGEYAGDVDRVVCLHNETEEGSSCWQSSEIEEIIARHRKSNMLSKGQSRVIVYFATTLLSSATRKNVAAIYEDDNPISVKVVHGGNALHKLIKEMKKNDKVREASCKEVRKEKKPKPKVKGVEMQNLVKVENQTVLIDEQGNERKVKDVTTGEILQRVTSLSHELKTLTEGPAAATSVAKARIKDLESAIAQLDGVFESRGSKPADKAG